jgi:hypothetical protein
MKTNIRAGFKDFKINNKGEASITLTVKAELTDEQILALHKLKSAGVVFTTISSAQTDIDDYEDEQPEPHQGITYKVDASGNVEADPNQVTFDELKTVDELPTDEVAQKRKRRTKAEIEADKAAAEKEVAQANKEAAASADLLEQAQEQADKDKEMLDELDPELPF